MSKEREVKEKVARFLEDVDRVYEEVGEILDEEDPMVVIAVLVRLMGVSVYYDLVHSDHEPRTMDLDQAFEFVKEGIAASYRDVERHEEENGSAKEMLQ